MPRYNDDVVNVLATDFLERNDLLNRHGNIIASFLALPGLRGFWPMSSFGNTGQAFDVSGNGRTLAYNGNPTYNFTNLVPYIDFGGTGDFLSRADEPGTSITGTETQVAAAVRGLTFGGWFWWDALPGANHAALGKWNTAGNQRSYLISTISAGNLRFFISTNGIAQVVVDSVSTIPTAAWLFCVGRFDPSTEIKLWIGSQSDGLQSFINTTSIPASIFDSSATFDIGSFASGSGLLDGRASTCFLCAAALSDAMVRGLFEQSRVLFGV